MIRYFTAGESHGEALVGIVEGCPAGVPVSPDQINHQLARRWLGYGRGGRSKFERDQIHIFSGIRFGATMGSPVALRLDNAAFHKDKAAWPEVMAVEGTGEGVDRVTQPRPGHADLVGVQKYRFDDIRPVIERSSARETAMRVACCTVARCLLERLGIRIDSHVIELGGVGYKSAGELRAARDRASREAGGRGISETADENLVRMLDAQLGDDVIERIKQAKSDGDTLGGRYEVVISGVPSGLGSYVQWDRKLDAALAHAIISIQAQKAVEIGDGVDGAALPGSQVHDEIVPGLSRSSNRAGGIEGGVSNGMPIIIRGFMKPIPTLIKPLGSVDLKTGEAMATRYERSDVTSVPAASVVAEAVVAVPLANAVLEKFGGDSLEELLERFPVGGASAGS